MSEPSINARRIIQAPRSVENGPSSKPSAVSVEPVFVHAMFRTGSTFLFGRFRRNERYRCFFEPLNEGLFRLNDWMLSRYSGPQAAMRMRHEELDLPYYYEYQPLRRWWGGVRGYHARFAYHDFFREHDAALAEYIRLLLASAAADGRQGMLKFVRSYGRLGFFLRLFPGQHLYLFRNPRDQWQSFMLKGRPYWMAMTCVIAALRPGSESMLSPRLNRPLPTHLRYMRLLGPLTVDGMLRAGKSYLRTLSTADNYRIFHYEWRQAYEAAVEHCQYLIDVDRLSADTVYRRRIEEQFHLQLDGCQIYHYEDYGLSLAEMAEIEAENGEIMR